jgi:hypothetical protein
VPSKEDYALSVFVLAKNKAEADELAEPKPSEEQFFVSAFAAARHRQLNIAAIEPCSAQASLSGSRPADSLTSPSSQTAAHLSPQHSTSTPLPPGSPNSDPALTEAQTSSQASTPTQAVSGKKPVRKNLWKLLKRSSLLQKKIEMDSFQEKLQKMEEKHMVCNKDSAVF